jgi:ribA/ribD-fused uncharacterized protein
MSAELFISLYIVDNQLDEEKCGSKGKTKSEPNLFTVQQLKALAKEIGASHSGNKIDICKAIFGKLFQAKPSESITTGTEPVTVPIQSEYVTESIPEKTKESPIIPKPDDSNRDKFLFYSGSTNSPAGKGKVGTSLTERKVTDFKYTDLQKIKDWRKILSNFYPCKFQFDGKTFNSAEHAFHYSKYKISGYEDKASEFTIESGHKIGKETEDMANVKKAGKSLKLNSEEIAKWDSVKDEWIDRIHREKFTQCLEAKKVLIATGDAELHHAVTARGKKAHAIRCFNLEKLREELRIAKVVKIKDKPKEEKSEISETSSQYTKPDDVIGSRENLMTLQSKVDYAKNVQLLSTGADKDRNEVIYVKALSSLNSAKKREKESNINEKLEELQNQLTELEREMAKNATSPKYISKLEEYKALKEEIRLAGY